MIKFRNDEVHSQEHADPWTLQVRHIFFGNNLYIILEN